MDALDRLGLRELWTYEVLVSTFRHSAPHAAPMGVWTDNGDELSLDAYKGSQTLANLLETGDFAVNFPVDSGTLYAAIRAPEQLAFTAARSVRAPLVAGCTACVELSASRTIDSGEAMRVTGTVRRVHQDGPIRLINRAEGLLLESLVLSTRQQQFEPALVAATLKENLRVVSKVAPGSPYQDALEALLRDAGASS